MNRSQVLALLQTHLPTIEAMGVRSLALFGSVARNEASPESDIDFAVEFTAPTTFDGYMNLKILLEDTLGQAIDLIPIQSMKPEVKATMQKDIYYVTQNHPVFK
jgi:uncharacterized protein